MKNDTLFDTYLLLVTQQGVIRSSVLFLININDLPDYILLIYINDLPDYILLIYINDLSDYILLIYINDLLDHIPASVKYSLFVDDAKLSRDSISMVDCYQLQNVLQIVALWSILWQLTLNIVTVSFSIVAEVNRSIIIT